MIGDTLIIGSDDWTARMRLIGMPFDWDAFLTAVQVQAFLVRNLIVIYLASCIKAIRWLFSRRWTLCMRLFLHNTIEYSNLSSSCWFLFSGSGFFFLRWEERSGQLFFLLSSWDKKREVSYIFLKSNLQCWRLFTSFNFGIVLVAFESEHFCKKNGKLVGEKY